MRRDSIEKYQSNIDFFNCVREKLDSDKSKVLINEPIKKDVLKEGFDKKVISQYDIVIASNIINEFPSKNSQVDFANNVIDGLKKSASFVLIETAFLKDTRSLKKIQYENAKSDTLEIVSPCGKLNGYSDRCSDCYSFRRESLKIPDTMKLFSKYLDDSDENEKLKWSYTIYSRGRRKKPLENKNGFISLNELSKLQKPKEISINVEIVSGRMLLDNDKKNYYLKICDQTEEKEQFILKIPNNYELPKYHFGDVFEVKNALIEPINWSKPRSVKFAIVIDPSTTSIANRSELSEPKGLVAFKDIEEKNIQYFLKRFFGYTEFNEGQFEILKKVLENLQMDQLL